MAEACATVVLAGLVAPHVLPLARVAPPVACAVWIAALALRAVLMVALALAALLVLPGTALFAEVAGWSRHVLAGPPHIDLSGEPLAHLSALAPPILIVVSLLAFATRLARAGLALRRELGRRMLGQGPADSLVIADRGLLVAVPSLGRGRILLSDRALAELDAAELDACLAHEAGHLRRRHRAVGLVGSCLATLARPLPGTEAARRGLLLSLERDADEYAVAHTSDPLALASAICKIVANSTAVTRGLAAFGADGTGETRARLDCLLAGGRRRGSGPLEAAALALALLMPMVCAAVVVGFGLWLADAMPPAALAAALSCAN